MNPTNNNIVWEAPEPPARGGTTLTQTYFNRDVRAMLAERPGEWARIATDISKNATGYWRSAFPRFEFTQRSAGRGYVDGNVDIYARYIGEGK